MDLGNNYTDKIGNSENITYFKNQGYDVDTATKLSREFLRYKNARQKWAKRGLEYEMVVNNDVDGTGTQFTREELDEIRDRNGIPLSVNISVAFIEQLQSFLTASKPSINVIPIGDSSKAYAYIHREIITTLLYLNDFYTKIEKAIFNMAVVGHGIIYVALSDYFIHNSFNVNIKCMDWRNIYFDPMCKEADYQDSELVFMVFPMLKTKARKIYNLSEEDMKYATANLNDYADYGANNLNAIEWGTMEDNNRMIFVYEVFEKVAATMYILENGKKTFDAPETTIDKQGNEIQTIDGVPVIDTIESTFVKKYIKIGNYIKDERMLPITMYPFAIYNHTHHYSPMPYGLVHHFIDLQHTLNKVLALTIQNAQTSSNAGMLASEGSITDKAKFQKEMSTPGGIAEYNPDQNLPNGGMPTQRMPQPLSNAWYTLVQQLIKLTEYITGIYELSMGNAENAPNTVGATNSIQNFGTQRPKMYARRIDIANQTLGEIIIQFYQAFAPQENLITLVNETAAVAEIQTNVSATIDQETGQAQIDPRGQDKATIVKNLVTQEVTTILGDIKVGQYKVRFTSASDLPTARSAAVQLLQSLMARMGNDSMAIAIAQSALKLMDYPEVDKVLKDTDVINQLQQQLQQVSQQAEQLAQQNKKLTSENEKLEKDVRMAELDAEVDKRMARIDMATDKFKEMKKEQEKQEVESEQETIS